MNARIVRQDTNGLCTLTLSRPEKLNALDTPAFEELDAHCAALEQDGDAIGCVVIRAEGRAFCAGADLAKIGSVTVDPRFKPGVIERLSALPQPVIAQVHGACFTGGLELALAADFIVADTTAHFADTHGKWGLVGAWGMPQRLPRRIGEAAAKRMMFTSRTVTAVEARDMGLIDMLAEAGALETCVGELAGAILANSRHTNFATKRILRESEGLPLAASIALANYRHPGTAPDHAERLAAFTRDRARPADGA